MKSTPCRIELRCFHSSTPMEVNVKESQRQTRSREETKPLHFLMLLMSINLGEKKIPLKNPSKDYKIPVRFDVDKGPFARRCAVSSASFSDS
jgi:hypothetical protein